MNVVYLCDLDGTVANLSHRLHFIQQKPAQWDAFFAACPDDVPIPEVIDTVRRLKKTGAEIIILSGRSETVRAKTLSLAASC